MRKMETFVDEREVKERIDQLKSQGVDESDITIIANRDLDVGGAFGDYSDVNLRSSEGSPWDKVVSFFTGENTRDQPVNDNALTEGEEEEFRQALDENKIILYVDSASGRDTDAPGTAHDDATVVEQGAKTRITDDTAVTERDRNRGVIDSSYGDATGVEEGAETRATDDYAATDRDRNQGVIDNSYGDATGMAEGSRANLASGDAHTDHEHNIADEELGHEDVDAEEAPKTDRKYDKI
ncbi:general stress protein [Salinicoccus sp. ID82-1]|uniref:general stress protein n=1 Tax=Salinicoccus sp. ID82-1 TaxID=2820269 RepID=UPI001F36E38A|nr:general stress protein [Salinicoccus sp. ID82-1]MCG1010742.1 general stress protein [Salinicoccus sp. ID82-1]